MTASEHSDEVLDLIFKPKSVAIIGLSRAAVGAPISVLSTLLDFDYAGHIHVINPNMAAATDYTVWANLDDIDEPIDLAIVSVPRERVLDVLRSCIGKGIRAAIVITQGFADSDDVGKQLQEEMIALAKDGGIRILGPNTIGAANAHANFSSSFIETYHDTTPIGLVSQSGLFMMGHNLVANEPGGFCMSADLGNAGDVGLVEVLDYFERQDTISVIACHLEAVKQGPEFVEAAARISRTKPIVALKAGKSPTAQAAVASHIGAAVGENRAYEAAFRKAGIVSARNAEELRLLAKAFTIYAPPKGKRVAVVSYSGGAAILAIDALVSAGLTLATLSEETQRALKEKLPEWMEVANPLDLWIPVVRDYRTAYPYFLEQILKDPGVDAVICIYCSYRLPKYDEFDASIYIRELAAKYPETPILGWTYGMDISGFTQHVERDGTAMVFPSFEDATQTLAKLVEWDDYRSRDAEPSAPKPVDADSDAVARILGAANDAGQQHLFTEGLEILQAYGINVAPWAFARDEDELIARSADIPYPLCLKVASPDIIHKSESGGIRVGIEDRKALVDNYHSLREAVVESAPDADISGVVVQSMAPDGKEVMIGAKRDATFGPSVALGAGGIYAEVLDDFAVRLAPLSEAEAYRMFDNLAFTKLLRGVRGEAPCDLASIVDTLLRVAQLVCDHPAIKEIDLNPLIVNEAGAVTVDARIIL